MGVVNLALPICSYCTPQDQKSLANPRKLTPSAINESPQRFSHDCRAFRKQYNRKRTGTPKETQRVCIQYMYMVNYTQSYTSLQERL